MKVDVTSRTVFVWDCPICNQPNVEHERCVADLSLVCVECKTEFDLGEVFDDV